MKFREIPTALAEYASALRIYLSVGLDRFRSRNYGTTPAATYDLTGLGVQRDGEPNSERMEELVRQHPDRMLDLGNCASERFAKSFENLSWPQKVRIGTALRRMFPRPHY